jgi:hypothetical protein
MAVRSAPRLAVRSEHIAGLSSDDRLRSRQQGVRRLDRVGEHMPGARHETADSVTEHIRGSAV